MGTRADFYIGGGESAEWLGSVAWDGMEWDADGSELAAVKTPEQMREALALIAKNRDDFTAPADGWPWPWNTSHTTDYAYALIDGKVVASVFGSPWHALGEASDEEDDDTEQGEAPVFPDMTARQNVTFGKRSGVFVVSPT